MKTKQIANAEQWQDSVTNEQHPQRPIRIGVATGIGALLWLGPYLGILNLANTGSQILGPIVAAAIVTAAHGSYFGIFPVCAWLALVGGILILFVHEDRQKI